MDCAVGAPASWAIFSSVTVPSKSMTTERRSGPFGFVPELSPMGAGFVNTIATGRRWAVP